jgi:hypothetical protein
MRRLLLFFSFGLLMVSALAVHAQDDDPFADLNPEAIFAEGVEVVGVRYDVRMPNRFYANAKVVIDNEARVIHVFQADTGGWLEFQLPPEVGTLENVMERNDGTFLFNQDFGGDNFGPIAIHPLQPTLPLWDYDPATGAFTPAETICGGYARQLPGDGVWLEVTDSRVSRIALCNTENGDLSRIVPDSVRRKIGQSPDGNWEIYDVRTAENRHVAEIYSYEVATGRELYLGTVENPAFGSVSSHWASNTRGFIFDNDQPESWKHNLLTFDVTEAESLDYLMSGWAEYQENPPRFEHLNTFHENDFRSEWDPDECILYIYHFSVQALASFLLGQNCFGRVLRRGDDYLYVTYLGVGNSNQRALYALNSYSNEKRRLFTDELLLGMDSISPNGRYAILYMANDVSEVPPRDADPWVYDYDDPFVYGDYGIGSRHVVFYDLVNEVPIAQMDIGWGIVMWMDNASFIQNYPIYGQDALNLYTLSGDGVERTHYFLYQNYSFEVSPDGEVVLLRQNPFGIGRTLIYWIKNRTFITIINPPLRNYEMQVEWITDTILDITFSKDNPFNSLTQMQTYTIRIPTPESEP